MHTRIRKSVVIAASIGGTVLLAVAVILTVMTFKAQEKEAKIKEEYEIQLQETKQQVESVKRTVLVAKHDLEDGEKIQASDLESVDTTVDAIPEGALTGEKLIGKILKIKVLKNTVITDTMVYEGDQTPDDLRNQEYSVINLPTKLDKGDYVDVRINFPTGQDFVVMAKKKIDDLSDTKIWTTVDEKELQIMSSAIVDSYLTGGRLYAVTYVDPQVQKKAEVTYVPSAKVLRTIKMNPNIVNTALTGLEQQLRKQLEQDLIISEEDRQKYISNSKNTDTSAPRDVTANTSPGTSTLNDETLKEQSEILSAPEQDAVPLNPKGE